MIDQDKLMKARQKKDFAAIEKHGFETNNMKGILLRQMTTGIYKEPNPRYMGKKQEQLQVAQELQRLTGKQVDLPYKDEITLSF